MRNTTGSSLQPQSPKTGQLYRPPNAELRDREYLTPAEVDRLLVGAKKAARHGHRNYTFILVSFNHGLRVTEAVNLKWTQVDLAAACLHIKRLKRGNPAVHPIPGSELRALRQMKRDYPESSFLFNSERGAPLTDHAARTLVRRAGEAAGFDFVVHPHMLRHACGYYLANKGVDVRTIQNYLGHRQLQHTVRYTELASGRFEGLFED